MLPSSRSACVKDYKNEYIMSKNFFFLIMNSSLGKEKEIKLITKHNEELKLTYYKFSYFLISLDIYTWSILILLLLAKSGHTAEAFLGITLLGLMRLSLLTDN